MGKFRQIWLIFLPALFLPVFLSARIPVIPLQFENAEKSESFRAIHLAERFRTLAAAVIQKKKDVMQVRMELSQTGHFQLSRDEKKVLTIQVPVQFALWRSDQTVHTWLMSVLLLAGMGEKTDADTVGKIRSHWIVRGLARKAANDRMFSTMSPGRVMPGAYALLSNGHCPALLQIVTPPPADMTNTSVAELDAEFAELLLDAVADTGLFRTGAGDALLHLALMEPDGNQYTALENLLKTDQSVLRERTAEEWFRDFAERRMINFMTPYSVEYFETKYREVTSHDFKDGNGMVHTCRPGNIAAYWKDLKEPGKVLDLWIAELNLMNFRVPQYFREELAGIRQALSRLRTEQTEEAQTQIRTAEQKLYRKITDYIAVGQLLRDAERKLESPAVRLRRTLNAAEEFRIHSRLLLPETQKNLDKWDEYR